MKSDELYNIEMTSKRIVLLIKIIQQPVTSQHFPHKRLHKITQSQRMHTVNDTIQYYLKNQCDFSEDQHKFVTAPQLNTFDMSAILEESINASMLPAPEPTIFNGNPLDYPSCKSSFYTLIESKNIKASEKIHYLKRYFF